MGSELHRTDLLERAIYHEICRRDGIKARELERLLPKDAAAAVYHHFHGKEEG